MRTALVLASVLAMFVVGTVQASPAVHSVSAGYGYYVIDDFGNPDLFRRVALSAQAGDATKGWWTWNRPEGTFGGPVTCVVTSGQDAWVAGPRTTGAPDFEAIFIYVHDGGTPGSQGDLTFVWGSDPGETLADMEALCSSMDTNFYGAFAFQVVSGNASVH
jgi:hypothetical protein